MPCCHGMFGSDAKLGEVKRKRGQDNCISRAAPFRGRLPLHERNNVKLFPVALDYLSLQSRNLDGGLSILVQPSSRWCPACRTDGLAVPALASLESLVLRLVFLDTSCCHLWWSSSCSGSSPAFWLAVVWQTVVTCKPCRCPRVPAAGGKVNCSPWPPAHIPMALGSNIPSHGMVLPVPSAVQVQHEIFW